MREALIDEFSYASETHSLGRILAIRAVESLSGQPFLKKLYLDYQSENLPPDSFWDEVIARLDLDLHIHAGSPAYVPETGPLVVVANHPYGVLDGIAICWLVAQRRKDFKILINSVLCRAREMTDHVLPIDFEPTPQALETNLQSRKLARAHLEKGGVVIVFPSGGIATTPHLWSRQAREEPWAPLVGQLVRRAKASVLPVYFAGQNSPLFQWASHISYAMRVALIFHEVRRRIGSRLDMVIGDVLDFDTLAPHLPPKKLARHLQNHVYDLARFLSR
ncbi:MAG: lysophospholipid acyltransferase family protein [Parvibaculales bacterium]